MINHNRAILAARSRDLYGLDGHQFLPPYMMELSTHNSLTRFSETTWISAARHHIGFLDRIDHSQTDIRSGSQRTLEVQERRSNQAHLWLTGSGRMPP